MFEKDIKYAFQKEFRIFIETTVQQTLDIKIGSIADISEICKMMNEEISSEKIGSKLILGRLVDILHCMSIYIGTGFN